MRGGHNSSPPRITPEKQEIRGPAFAGAALLLWWACKVTVCNRSVDRSSCTFLTSGCREFYSSLSNIVRLPENFTTRACLHSHTPRKKLLQTLASLAHARVSTRTLLISFEPLPLPQPRVGLGGSLAVHLTTDEVLVCQTRVQGRLRTVARSKKLGQRVASVAGREGKDGILALSQHNAISRASTQSMVRTACAMG